MHLEKEKIEKGERIAVTNLEKNKYEMIDILKFIFAIFVVGIHTHIMSNSKDTCQWYILHVFFRLAVPFFFIASGFLFGKKYMKNKANIKEISKTQIKRLLIPFMFWMLVSLPYVIVTTNGNNIFEVILEILKNVIFYPWGALWFILALIVAIGLEYSFLKKEKVKLAVCIGLVLYCICLLGNSYYFILEGTPLQNLMDTYTKIFLTTRNGLFEAFPIFTVGVYIALIEKNIEKMNKNKFLISFAIAILIMICEVTFIRNQNYKDDHSLFFTTIVVVSLLLIMCIKCKRLRFKRINTIIFRNLSTSIYFMHSPIIHYAELFNIYLGNWKMFFLTIFLIITISLILYKINNKYINYIIK